MRPTGNEFYSLGGVFNQEDFDALRAAATPLRFLQPDGSLDRQQEHVVHQVHRRLSLAPFVGWMLPGVIALCSESKAGREAAG